MKVMTKLLAVLGSIKEQVGIARATTMAGQNILKDIELSLMKCTDQHDTLIEEKYVHEILFQVSNAPGAITFLARRISVRLQTTRDFMVALKTLVLLHRLLRGGDRYFEQDLHSLWSSGELRMDMLWCSAEEGCLHSFLLKYSSFLKERIGWIINQAGMLEPIRLLQSEFPSAKEHTAEWVLYRLSKCQVFLDQVMDCLSANYSSCSSQMLQSAFNIMLRESIRVYRSFFDDMEIMLSSNFDPERSLTKLALDILKKACMQTPILYEFFERCGRSNAGKSLEYPVVRIITSDQVSELEQLLPTHAGSAGRDKEVGNKLQESNVVSLQDPTTPVTTRPKIFPQRLETTVSTVWVNFDEDEPLISYPVRELDDYSMTEADHSIAETYNDLFNKDS